MPNRKKISVGEPLAGRIWTFDPVRRVWELNRVPEVNAVSIASGCALTHLGGVVLPTVSQYLLVSVGVVLSLLLRSRGAQLVMAAANVIAVPVIIRWVPEGADHLARIDYANLGPIVGMVGCLVGVELARVLYGRWRWTLCLPALLVPRLVPRMV